MKEDAEAVMTQRLRDPKLRQELLRQELVSYGGLIAGCVAVMQPFLTASALDTSALIAVVSFALAIPLLAALLMVSQQEVYRHRSSGSRVMAVAKAAGQGLAVLGFAAAFWHVIWIAGAALLVSGLVAIGVHSAGWSRVEGLG
jgi:phosphatidylserine synthase